MALSKLLCFFVYFAGQMSDGMANSFFKFKQFTIHQEHSAMTVPMAYYWALGAGWKNRIAFWILVQEQD